MRIAFLSYNMINGGAQRVLSILGSELAKEHEILFILGSRCENEYKFSEKIKVVSLFDENPKPKILNKLSLIKHIRSFLLEFNAEMAIPFMGFAEETYIACLGTHIKYVSAIRNNPSSSPKSKIRRKIRDYLVSVSDACIVQNREQQVYFSERIQKKIFVLPNPVGDDYINASDHEYRSILRIVTLGRLREQKNHKLLIDAFVDVMDELPEDCKLDIYGVGPLRDELQTLIENRNAQNRVRINGFCSDVISVYNEADLFVLSSDFEGMPNALLEAMTLGVPCISTECPTGPSDMIENNVNGLLVPVGDRKSLSNAILRISNDTELARRLGINARKDCIQKYEKGNVARRFIEQVSFFCNI